MYKSGFDLNFSVLHIQMLQKIQLIIIMYMNGGPLENIQNFVLVWYGYLLRLVYLEVWRRMRSLILITHWLITHDDSSA